MQNDSNMKLKYQPLKKNQMSYINIVFKKRRGRNYSNKKINGKTLSSLSKINNEPIQKSENNNNYDETNLINYYEKKRHLSFYKGTSINVSSILLDTNKTTYSNNIHSTSISMRNIKRIRKIHSQNKVHENISCNIITNNNEQSLEKKNKKKEEIKSTINPYLDVSKLTYKADITNIRNKFSILFSKEYDLFDKFIPSLYTLRLEPDIKAILCQLHNNSLSCIKYLSNLFLNQEVEQFKITKINLISILSNLLNLFTYNTKINHYLIKHTKKYILETNQERKNNKVIIKEEKKDDNIQIKNLMKKISTKNETIKKIKQEQLERDNNYILNMYKLRDEKKDLIKLLLTNKNYFLKYQDSQKEIKEKNDIIIQKNIDYNSLEKKTFLEKVELKDIIEELQTIVNPIEEENKKMKEKLNDLENKQITFDQIIKNKNNIINQLKENLMMKNEELLKCLCDLNKANSKNDQLCCDFIAYKKTYKIFSEKENKLIIGDYEDEV